MAVVIGSTTVIDDSRRLQNVVSANGFYDDFHANPTAITTSLDFNRPLMTRTMAGNETYTEANKGIGRTAVLILDTTASGHIPTFSSDIKWPGDAEPTWSDHRYWNIAFVCWDSTVVRAAAVGFDS